MKTKKHQHLGRKLSLIGLLLVIALGVSQAFTQQDRGPSTVSDTLMAKLIKMKGRVISEGRNTQAVSQLKLVSYRLEELSLPQTVTLDINQRSVEVNKAWRLTVTGGPFPVRALPPVIWIDDVPLGSGVENDRLTEISVITFDRSLLREGGVIALSYGENKETRAALPETLSVTGR